eukprot:g78304.t1
MVTKANGFGEYVPLPDWVSTIAESRGFGGFGDHGCGDHGFGDHGYDDHGYGDHGFGDHGYGDHGFGDHGFGEYVQLPGWVRTLAKSMASVNMASVSTYHGRAGYVQLPKATASVSTYYCRGECKNEMVDAEEDYKEYPENLTGWT